MDLGGHRPDLTIPMPAAFTAASSIDSKLKLSSSTNNNNNSSNNAAAMVAIAEDGKNKGAVVAATTAGVGTKKPVVRYRECLRNHAASIGGHAVDGCGEFMPPKGYIQEDIDDDDASMMRCAACDCHRNFHRREVEGAGGVKLKQQLGSPGSSSPSPSLGLGYGAKKRFRTKFTGEQKERMQALAERLGWRIQKHNEAEVQHFCADVGVKRHVLKVWMHNNKHTYGSRTAHRDEAASGGGAGGGVGSSGAAIAITSGGGGGVRNEDDEDDDDELHRHAS